MTNRYLGDIKTGLKLSEPFSTGHNRINQELHKAVKTTVNGLVTTGQNLIKTNWFEAARFDLVRTVLKLCKKIRTDLTGHNCY